MRLIAHISDLHFGRHDPRVVGALTESLWSEQPSLVAVSGDLTQRARRHEFSAAKTFLDAVPFPKVVVPGNHDLSFNLWSRMVRPLERFKSFIGRDDGQSYRDEQLTVVGLNTARALAFTEGRVSHDQIIRLDGWLHGAADTFKVVVTHHPFIPPAHLPSLPIVRRGLLALKRLEHHGVHVLLAGHLHRRFTRDARAHYPTLDRSILVMQAGTAASTRLRGETNSYNLVEIAPPRLRCVHMRYDGRRFVPESVEEYDRVDDQWRAAD